MIDLKALWAQQWFKFVVTFAAGCALTTVVYPSVSREKDTETQIRETVTQEYEKKLTDVEKERDDIKQKSQDEISSLRTESSQKQEELQEKILSLTSEVSSLSKQTFTETVEIRKPDGTVEKHRVSTTQLQTLNQKVAQIQQETEKKYSEQISKLEQDHQVKLQELQSTHQQELTKLSDENSKTQKTLDEERKTHEEEIANVRKLGLGFGYNTDRTYKATGHYYLWGPVFGGIDLDTNLRDIYRAGLAIGISF